MAYESKKSDRLYVAESPPANFNFGALKLGDDSPLQLLDFLIVNSAGLNWHSNSPVVGGIRVDHLIFAFSIRYTVILSSMTAISIIDGK